VDGALRAILDVADIQVMPAETPERAGGPGAEAAGRARAGRAAAAGKSVRIDVARLDALLDLVGELVIDRTRLADLASRLGAAGGVDPDLAEALAEATQHLARITDELQDQVMQSRMLPIEHVFSRLPRLVRDLAQRSGKQVQLVVSGQETELDRSVIEEIGDPLIHLLRNAVDHGIEPPEERERAGKPGAGTIRLAASHEENQIVIVVEDDGRGISADGVKESALRKGLIAREQAERLSADEAVNLIFTPGFSTRTEVTDISGRGVGMDIVRANIERLNGSVAVRTAPGRGTRFTIRLPLTLAIIRALLVRVAGETYALPIAAVTETLRVFPDEVEHVRGREAIRLRGDILPLIRLADLFGFPVQEEAASLYVVAVRHGARPAGLVVDGLVGEQEVVIKSLSRALGEVRGVSGATILGDGRVALIVDVPSLLQDMVAVR
jgi:two-component system chemotaxis sensor kinase CheA